MRQHTKINLKLCLILLLVVGCGVQVIYYQISTEPLVPSRSPKEQGPDVHKKPIENNNEIVKEDSDDSKNVPPFKDDIIPIPNEEEKPTFMKTLLSRDIIKESNTKVFIMSLPRAGSSFLGELFKQNPNFVYLYETTYGFRNGVYDKCSEDVKMEQADMIKEAFNCDFRSLKKAMDAITWDHVASWFRAMEYSSNKDKIELCFPKPEDSIERIQERTRKNIAMKEIVWWAPKLNSLYLYYYYLLIITQMSFDIRKYHSVPDLKLIWLVRDVRGWVSSFLQPEPNTHSDSIYAGWHYNQKDLWQRYIDCRHLDAISPSKLKQLADLLSDLSAPRHKRLAAQWTVDITLTKHYLDMYPGKFFLVQYEHLSLYPLDTLQQIYNFVDEPLNYEVVSWVSKATAKGNMKDRYSTFRNSTKMPSIWTTRLQEIMEIEEIASDWFSFFDYTPIQELLKH